MVKQRWAFTDQSLMVESDEPDKIYKKNQSTTMWNLCENINFTYWPSSLINKARMLSVWPVNLLIRFPDLGSHNLTTFSGDPDTNILPVGLTAKA